MRIGVVSDTHDNLKNVERIVELFNAAGVERVVHTGDITQAKTLRALSRLRAPLVGVFGNNDLERESLEDAVEEFGFHFSDPPLRREWAGRLILVVHDVKEHEPDVLYEGHLLLHGHDHRRRIERLDGTLVFNPGECAGHLDGHNAVGVVDLESLTAEVLLF